ncbi:MAG: hypothetical protein A3F43_03475 [Gammaproteobacteria bacterium RIFCSPHIGHO2_12_FULL_42_10]|nr:MAG: hypothetical protein A3F43_03475 [Gammaproteobacteria bacterium RIFCSPHIGHO2_12_FULL_42_10]
MQYKNILRSTLVGLAVLLPTTFTWAMQSLPYGWYFEADVGSATLNNQDTPNNVSVSGSGLGANANVGYKFMPFLGIEIGYTRYPNGPWKISSSDTKIGNSTYYSYDAAAKGIVPIIDSGLEAFAKVGVGHIVSHLSITDSTSANSVSVGGSSHSATGLFTGLGLQYYLMPEIAFLAEWTRMQGSSSTGNEQLISGGISVLMS